MKAARFDKAVVVLLSFIILISMIVNVYNGYLFDIPSSDGTTEFNWEYHGWWAASFAGSLLLFAVSQTMYWEKRNGSVIVMGLTALLAIFVIILMVL